MKIGEVKKRFEFPIRENGEIYRAWQEFVIWYKNKTRALISSYVNIIFNRRKPKISYFIVTEIYSWKIVLIQSLADQKHEWWNFSLKKHRSPNQQRPQIARFEEIAPKKGFFPACGRLKSLFLAKKQELLSVKRNM